MNRIRYMRCPYSPSCREGVSLLKKSPLDRSVVPSQVQNAQKWGSWRPNSGQNRARRSFSKARVFSETHIPHKGLSFLGAQPRLKEDQLGPAK
jgi:hypothetical protein